MTRYGYYRAINLARLQIAHFAWACRPNVPEWYETRRKTTQVFFWS